MPRHATADVYSPREIALAAGVAVGDAVAAVGCADALLPWTDAVRIGRALAQRDPTAALAARPLFVAAGADLDAPSRLPLAISGAVHAAALALFVLAASLAPRAAAPGPETPATDPARLVYLIEPGPGGGGGGGGALHKTPAPPALAKGRHRISSPLPVREPLTKSLPPPTPAPLAAEVLPPVVAPVAASAADPRTRPGAMAADPAQQADSRGPGLGGGVGVGGGTGLGEGTGAGIGAGSGGGTGGGAYAPGSGIDPPRLLREVKADYTDDARQRGIEGDVVLEIVVRRDGTVGDLRVLQGLDSGLNARAIAAVRQWRFAPARRLGTPLDVVVQVSVEFRLR